LTNNKTHSKNINGWLPESQAEPSEPATRIVSTYKNINSWSRPNRQNNTHTHTHTTHTIL